MKKHRPKRLVSRFTKEITEIQSCPCWGDYVLCFREPVILNIEKHTKAIGKKINTEFYYCNNNEFNLITGSYTFKELIKELGCMACHHWDQAHDIRQDFGECLIGLCDKYLENCYVKEQN